MESFEYPEQTLGKHREIVEKLLNGVFIPTGGVMYDILLQHTAWYSAFLRESFDIELRHDHEIFYCVNGAGEAKFAGKVLTVLAIVMYEIQKQGHDPVEKIQNDEFTVERLKTYIEESVQFSHLLKTKEVGARFVNRMDAIGLIRWVDGEDGSFTFTRAVDLFLEEYTQLQRELPSLEASPSD